MKPVAQPALPHRLPAFAMALVRSCGAPLPTAEEVR